MDRQPDDDAPDEAFQPNDWISAAETIFRVRTATLSPTSEVSIATRALAGLIRANAVLLIIESKPFENAPVPARFWWAKGYAALTQNWELGDFETWIDKRVQIRAFGVRFRRDDVDKMLGSQTPTSSTPVPPLPAKESGGRPMSELWPDWVAELAFLLHNEGWAANETIEQLTTRVADALATRGLDAPSRTSVRDAVRAVLHRLRSGGN